MADLNPRLGAALVAMGTGVAFIIYLFIFFMHRAF